MNYNWIDDNVAVGNFKSSYEDFDVIVNLNYPFNEVPHEKIERNMQLVNFKEKIIFKIGLYDNENERIYNLLVKFIPELIYLYNSNKNIKILFHCYAGISRSSTLAIAFLCKAKGLKLSDALNLAVSKRMIIKPNDGFLKALKEYCE